MRASELQKASPSSSPPSPTGRSARAAVLYIVIAGTQRALSALSVPFFAAVLSPAQFGQIAVLASVSALTLTVLGFGLDSVIYRAVHARNRDTELPEPDVSTIQALSTWLLVVPVLATTVLAAVVLTSPFPLLHDRTALAIALMGAGTLTAATVAPLSLLRAREDLRGFATLALFAALSQLTARIVLVGVLDGGVRAWVTADLLSAALTVLVGLRWHRQDLTRHVDVDSLRAGFRLGLPLVPHASSHWVLSISDRLILALFVSQTVIGLYAMGYQIGALVVLVLTELNRAFMPRYAQANSSREVARFVRAHIVLCLLVAGLAAMLGPQLILLFLPSSYAGAAGFVGWAALGGLFMGLYYVPMALLVLINGTSERIWRSSVVAAAVNLGLNLLLVPHLGAIAAAVNTAVGYGLLLLLLLRHAAKTLPHTHLELRRVLPLAALTVGIALPSSIAAARPGPVGLTTAVLGSVATVVIVGTALRSELSPTVGDAA